MNEEVMALMSALEQGDPQAQAQAEQLQAMAEAGDPAAQQMVGQMQQIGEQAQAERVNQLNAEAFAMQGNQVQPQGGGLPRAGMIAPQTQDAPPQPDVRFTEMMKQRAAQVMGQ